jgi:hypothetical protein
VSSPVLGDASKGPSAVSSGAVSGQEPEYDPGHCLSEPVPAEGNHIGGEVLQDCEDCKHVRQVLKELVSGFLRLRQELLTSIPASTPPAL